VRFSDVLAAEWRPALGCTEPASIAWAAASAAALAGGRVRRVRLVCDPRTYKNCYAVGIPHSGHRTGILWALALGAQLPDPSARLELFRRIDDDAIARAQALLSAGAVQATVDPARAALLVDGAVEAEGGCGRAVIERDHTQLVLLEKDGVPVPLDLAGAVPDPGPLRAALAGLPFGALLALARSLEDGDRALLREGAERNVAMARHGLGLFPPRFVDTAGQDSLTRLSRLVCAGVYARMWGEPLTVMSLAGSGNKGIVASVPLWLWGREAGFPDERIAEALALAVLVTSSTTHHLGALSAVCGCSNAAGIGLAAGIALLEGGDEGALSRAVTNMVGNVTGMICDGAKIGCALKTMTAVDSAFRAASLALSGIGIPASDGIVGADGRASLANLGRIATRGMASADAEILAIMQEKLESGGAAGEGSPATLAPARAGGGTP
jgi:L-cysteine desulfidase